MASSTTSPESPATTSATNEPTREQWDAIRAQFHFFNKKLFDGKLPEVMLNMSRHAKSYGFFAPDRWKHITATNGKSETTHEISLNPDHLGRDPRAVASTLVHEMAHLWRDPRAVASTLVHEMAHLWQEVFGKKKGSRGYHNKEWGTKMETLGLMPSSTAAPGGRRTGKNMSHYILEGGAFAMAWKELPERHQMPWRSGIGSSADASAPEPRKKDPSKMKYTCRCGLNIWGKKDLRITCNDCAGDFVMKDVEDDD